MSNYLAIATVTAAFASLVRDAMYDVPDLSNAPDVRIARPLPDPNFVGAHLFLYRVAPNGFLRNEDLPTRNGDGRLVTRPSYAADLEYVLSFYGNDQSFEPQRLLGRVVTALHAEPVLTAERIRTAIKSTSVLRASTLDRDLQPVRLVPLAIDLEDLSRMWSVFYQTPYNLALAYAASVVILDAEIAPAPAAPVSRISAAAVAAMPRIDALEPARVVTGLDNAVRVHGSGLAGDDTLRFAGVPAGTSAVASDMLVAAPPLAVGRVPVDVLSAGGAVSAPATLLVAPLIGAPSLAALSVDGRRTLSVAATFRPDPHQRYTFMLTELRDDDRPRHGIEADALFSWIDEGAAGPIAGDVVGNRLAAAINDAVRPSAAFITRATDALRATPGGWRITNEFHELQLHSLGNVLAIAWGLAPNTTLACDAAELPAGTYAIALCVDGNAASTSPLWRGSRSFTLPNEPAPANGAPLSAGLRAALTAAGVALSANARTIAPLPHSALVVPSADAAPVAWLELSDLGIVGYTLAADGAVIAPVVEVPA